jgi:hypothetical protein
VKNIERIDRKVVRISLFRLHPAQHYEDELIKAFKSRLNSKVVIYKLLGAYDIACIYPTQLDHRILFHGVVEGIRSYSNIDCVCWGNNVANKYLDRLRKHNLLGIITAAAKEESLVSAGGIHHQDISTSIKRIGMYLNSLSWGEQIIFLTENKMNSLFDKSKKVICALSPIANDLQHSIAINLDFISNIEETPPKATWNEKIPKNITLLWEVELACRQGVKSDFQKQIIEGIENSTIHLELKDTKTTITALKLYLTLKGRSWGDIIKGIRRIRSNASDLIVSTRLQIFQKDKFDFKNTK